MAHFGNLLTVPYTFKVDYTIGKMNSIDIDTTPISLEKLTVEGADGFNPKFIENVISPLFQSSTQSIGDLVKDGNKVMQQLRFLGNFRDVKLLFDLDTESKPKFDEFNNALTNITGTIHLHPLPKSNIRIKNVHNDAYNYINASYSNNNVFGSGENLTINSMYNFRTLSQNLNIYFSKPTINTSLRLFGDFNSIKTNDTIYQSANQNSSSLQFGLIKQKYCKHSGALATLTGGFNIVNRNIHDVDDSANDEVKIYAGESLKNSIFLNILSTNMKFLTSSGFKLPMNGFSVGVNNEVSGIASLIDASSHSEDQFYKLNVNLDYVKSFLGNGLTFSSNFKFGSILNFNALNGGTIHFQDKFYPIVSGNETPIMPLKSVGAGSFLSYNFGVYTKAGLIDINNPIRLYYSINGCTTSNEISKIGELKNLNDWKHGLDVGLVYNKGENSARLSWKQSLDSDKPGKFGFEVDIAGDL